MANHWQPRRGEERRKSGHKLKRRHHPVGAASPRILDSIGDLAVFHDFDTLKRDRRSGAIPHESFPAHIVVGLEANRTMHVDPLAPCGEPALASVEVGIRIGLRFRWLGEEGASRKRELFASFYSGRLGWLIATIFRRALVDMTMSLEPSHEAEPNALGNHGDVFVRGGQGLVESDARLGLLEHAVHTKGVQVRIEIHGPAEDLREPDGARLADAAWMRVSSLNAEYDGVRVTTVARIAGAQVHVQVDIGFGDAIAPGAEFVDFRSVAPRPTRGPSSDSGDTVSR